MLLLEVTWLSHTNQGSLPSLGLQCLLETQDWVTKGLAIQTQIMVALTWVGLIHSGSKGLNHSRLSLTRDRAGLRGLDGDQDRSLQGT